MQRESLYSPDSVKRLFEGMAATYGTTNLISSFGFCRRWRDECLSLGLGRGRRKVL